MFDVVCGGFIGGLQWFGVVCGGLWWFAVVCGNSMVPLINVLQSPRSHSYRYLSILSEI